MTANKRIFLNVIATYGRSLFNIACGLFSVRWVLSALGHDNYGLFNVIGGLTVFIGFINVQLSSAIGRYFAVSIGEYNVASDKGLAMKNSQEWFSVAVVMQTIIPLLLVFVGYPLGAYAISKGWVHVPDSQLNDCIWLWRCACISCLMGMLSSPFVAMLLAKQNIAEMTLIGIGQTVVRTIFFYYMTLVPKYWLVDYAVVVCVITCVPYVIMGVLAVLWFPECKFRATAFMDFHRMKQIATFAGWELVALVGLLFRGQGLSIAINNRLGSKVNAAMSVSTQLAGETAALSGAMLGAFTPAITTAYGEGDVERVKKMAIRTSKYATLMTSFFAIPLILELDSVMNVWLKTPPAHAIELCRYALLAFLIDKLTQGHGIAIGATGRIGMHRALRSLAYVAAFPILLSGLYLKLGSCSVGFSLVLSSAFVMLVDIYVAKADLHMSVKSWLTNVVMKLLLVAVPTILIALIPLCVMHHGLMRFLIVGSSSVIVFCVVLWGWGLDDDERKYVGSRICQKITFLFEGMKA